MPHGEYNATFKKKMFPFIIILNLKSENVFLSLINGDPNPLHPKTLLSIYKYLPQNEYAHK